MRFVFYEGQSAGKPLSDTMYVDYTNCSKVLVASTAPCAQIACVLKRRNRPLLISSSLRLHNVSLSLDWRY